MTCACLTATRSMIWCVKPTRTGPNWDPRLSQLPWLREICLRFAQIRSHTRSFAVPTAPGLYCSGTLRRLCVCALLAVMHVHAQAMRLLTSLPPSINPITCLSLFLPHRYSSLLLRVFLLFIFKAKRVFTRVFQTRKGQKRGGVKTGLRLWQTTGFFRCALKKKTFSKVKNDWCNIVFLPVQLHWCILVLSCLKPLRDMRRLCGSRRTFWSSGSENHLWNNWLCVSAWCMTEPFLNIGLFVCWRVLLLVVKFNFEPGLELGKPDFNTRRSNQNSMNLFNFSATRNANWGRCVVRALRATKWEWYYQGTPARLFCFSPKKEKERGNWRWSFGKKAWSNLSRELFPWLGLQIHLFIPLLVSSATNVMLKVLLPSDSFPQQILPP